MRACLGHLVPSLTLRIGEEIGTAGTNLIRYAHVFGMVCDRDPVQRPVLLEVNTVVHDDFPARGNLEEIVGAQRYPKHSRIERVPRVDMGNAPVDAIWEGLTHVRGILPCSNDRGRCWLGGLRCGCKGLRRGASGLRLVATGR